VVGVQSSPDETTKTMEEMICGTDGFQSGVKLREWQMMEPEWWAVTWPVFRRE